MPPMSPVEQGDRIKDFKQDMRKRIKDLTAECGNHHKIVVHIRIIMSIIIEDVNL